MSKKTLRAAAERTHTAADRRDAADRAVSAISDYVQSFAPYVDEAKERIEPLLNQAHDRVQPLLEQAHDRIDPLLEQAQDKIGPYAEQAKKEGAAKAAAALGLVGPTLGAARDKVQDDLLPKLQDVLDAAADSPAGQEAAKRAKEATKEGKKAVAKLRGELPEPKKSHKGLKTLGGLALVAAVAGAAYVAFKKFFAADAKDPWQSYEPASPFAKPPAAAGAAETSGETVDRIDSEEGDVAGADPATEAASEGMVGDVNEVEPEGLLAADATTADQTKDQAADSAEKNSEKKSEKKDSEDSSAHADGGYGDGAYVGIEPPEGFTIKGNERSKKFHTPDSGGFDRTIADVWFNSEDAAQAAGFTKAQR